MEYSPVVAVMLSVWWFLPPELTLAVQDSGAAMGATCPPVFVKYHVGFGDEVMHMQMQNR